MSDRRASPDLHSIQNLKKNNFHSNKLSIIDNRQMIDRNFRCSKQKIQQEVDSNIKMKVCRPSLISNLSITSRIERPPSFCDFVRNCINRESEQNKGHESRILNYIQMKSSITGNSNFDMKIKDKIPQTKMI